MKIDMSPEAITNRLKTMEQLWELSISLSKAEPLESNVDKDSDTALLSEKSLKEDWDNSQEDNTWQHSDKLPTV